MFSFVLLCPVGPCHVTHGGEGYFDFPLLPVTGDPVVPWDRWLALVHTGLAEALVSLSQAEGIVNLRPAHFLG